MQVERLSVVEFRKRLAYIVNDAHHGDKPTIITRHDTELGVFMPMSALHLWLACREPGGNSASMKASASNLSTVSGVARTEGHNMTPKAPRDQNKKNGGAARAKA